MNRIGRPSIRPLFDLLNYPSLYEDTFVSLLSFDRDELKAEAMEVLREQTMSSESRMEIAGYIEKIFVTDTIRDELRCCYETITQDASADKSLRSRAEREKGFLEIYSRDVRPQTSDLVRSRAAIRRDNEERRKGDELAERRA